MGKALRQGLKGFDEFKDRLPILLRNIDDALDEVLFDDANDLLGRAQDISPQLSGDHINSGEVFDNGNLSFSVFFDQPYSLWLHEGHYKLGPVSRRKPPTEDGEVGREYLIRPFENHKQRYIDNAGEAVDDAVQRWAR